MPNKEGNLTCARLYGRLCFNQGSSNQFQNKVTPQCVTYSKQSFNHYVTSDPFENINSKDFKIIVSACGYMSTHYEMELST